MTSFRWIAVIVSSSVLAVGVAACGSSSDNGGSGGGETFPGRSTSTDRAPSSRSPRRPQRASRARTRESMSPWGSPGPAVASRSSAPARPRSRTPPADRARGELRLQEEGDHLRRLPGRQRRDLDRHQPRPRSLPDHRSAEAALEQGLDGRQLRQLGKDADGKPLPDASVSLYGPGTDSGTFDFFTDEINGGKAGAAPTTSPRRTTTSSSRECRATPTASATSGSPITRRTRTS